jgi:hypothetical protein
MGRALDCLCIHIAVGISASVLAVRGQAMAKLPGQHVMVTGSYLIE